jgi:UDP-N-acetylglucosamine 2-epimerase (non-hydrolysing)
MKPRVLVVIGTRPEGIKLAPVIDALHGRSELETRVALTGQHTDLLDQALQAFSLHVDWDLGIMREGQDLFDLAHGCLRELRGVVEGYRPELLLVQGDTASVFFGALVAYFERTRVGHVEAGLRSGDKWRPFPEEVFRHMTGVVADLHFAPTPDARANLLAENVDPATIYLTGNTVVDALQRIAAQDRPVESPELNAALEEGRRLVLITAHRRESFGEPLRRAFAAIREAADQYPDALFLYPVHPNPSVRDAAAAVLSGHARIRLIDPLSYTDLVAALRRSALVLTDSGGIQEEAPSFGVPVLVLREVTERPEGVRAGAARLVGTDPVAIREGIDAVLGAGPGERPPLRNPYGDGRAGERIADIVAHTLADQPRRTSDWDGGS